MKLITRTLIVLSINVYSSTAVIHRGGILFPRESETRQVASLDGIWNFIAPVLNTSRSPFIGFEQYWYKRHLQDIPDVNVIQMPVPSSYNDITTDWQIRDHVGLVWYDRSFFVPKFWSEVGRVWLRFESVNYAAQVWINGQLVMSHEIGHLPFVSDITANLNYGKENYITVAVDNTLLPDTVPQGRVVELESGRLEQTITFDFFNYAGIHRPVKLYTTPKNYIDDITVVTLEALSQRARLNYNVTIEGSYDMKCKISLLDKNKKLVANNEDTGECLGDLYINNPKLWWPYLMDPEPGYLYSLEVELLDNLGEIVDKYVQPVGLRELSWTNTSFLINGKPLYLHGFGRHEDSDIRGKGLDLPLIIRDYNLIKWVGANAYRTSHYPYAEEIMDLADQYGIMIIDECPGVNIEIFSENLLNKHKISLTELIKRDKNRPAVIMWSAANEPRTQYAAAKDYFRKVIEHIKTLDTTRPTTIVEFQGVTVVESSQFVDIISFNRYNGWYIDPGNLDVVTTKVINEATAWHNKFNKPVIMQEYGADTLEGLHFAPGFIWSEEYQVELMSKHFEAFDQLRSQGFFIGEFIWNFADFKTMQDYTRVGGNKKGIFTRSRQPKASAHHLRRRYWGLAKEFYNVSLPSDLNVYVIRANTIPHQELKVIEHIKTLDTTRPTTIVEAQGVTIVQSSQFVDIVSFNRYNGWYIGPGNLDVVTSNVINEATAWHNKFNKPVIMQEYGADTLEGLHFAPDFIWSEEYQVDLMSKHFEAFDQLRNQGFFIGEFIWNFADFKTMQEYTRVGGNKKGIFTRNRQPKASAHHLRKRYWSLAKEFYNVSLPSDLNLYVIRENSVAHQELKVIEHIKTLDTTRPTTIAEFKGVTAVKSSEFVDIISFNSYYAWYSNGGNLDVVTSKVIKEATAWHKKFNKPVIMQEYGADTSEGLHSVPTFIWSEEYQVDLMSKHFKAFDQLRNQGFFIGEFIWNFVDFKTMQDYTRVGGNKKGIFTRNRQPKASAHHLRKRYWGLAKEFYNVSLPSDLNVYVIKANSITHQEL